MLIFFRLMAALLLVWLMVVHFKDAWDLFSSEGSAFMGYFKHSDAIHWDVGIGLSCLLVLSVVVERWVKGK